MDHPGINRELYSPFERCYPQINTGLSVEQIRKRMEAGAHNLQPQNLTPTVGQIIRKNTLTLFNIIHFALAILLLIVGQPKNTLFLGIVFSNILLGIVQELRAKRTLDKLSILAQGKVTVVRNGKTITIDQADIVLDDIVCLMAGGQICADAIIVESDGLEVNESFLTGETDNIRKKAGDTVLSGSFVTSGQAHARVTAVGADSYATALTIEAKKEKSVKSVLLRTINTIIKILTFIILPVGVLLFYTQYNAGAEFPEAVSGSAAAMLGMIPQGLVLLASITLTVSAVNLAKRNTLVQSLYSIETLARVDVLCLDKTGTITDGTLSFERIIPIDSFSEEAAEQALSSLMSTLRDKNATANALRAKFRARQTQRPVMSIPFSSSRKWSGVSYETEGSYILGAPGFVFTNREETFFQTADLFAADGYRVLCLAYSSEMLAGEQLPDKLVCMALVILSDTIRRDAVSTFQAFAQENVTLKVISGDHPLTVSTIASKAGIEGSCIDMSNYPDNADLKRIAEENTIFGRVSPLQKRELIRALKKNGHTTCMTGDGVNDVLAMKESDCSVSMISGSDAARGVCDFVIMSAGFSSMVNVLKEGRRVINNIETVSALYLVQPIYSVLLSIFYILLNDTYPFTPLQMTPINALTVGIPAFFLALRANYQRPEGRLMANILELSLPAALTVLFNILIIRIAGITFELSMAACSTMNVFLIGIVGLALLVRVSRPYTFKIMTMLVLMGAAFVILFIFFRWIFQLDNMLTRNVFFYLPLAYASPQIFLFLSRRISSFSRRIGSLISRW